MIPRAHERILPGVPQKPEPEPIDLIDVELTQLEIDTTTGRVSFTLESADTINTDDPLWFSVYLVKGKETVRFNRTNIVWISSRRVTERRPAPKYIPGSAQPPTTTTPTVTPAEHTPPKKPRKRYVRTASPAQSTTPAE